MKNKTMISALAETEKAVNNLAKTVTMVNKINDSAFMGITNALETYQLTLKSSVLGMSESLQKALDTYAKVNMSYLSSVINNDAMYSSLRAVSKSLEIYSKSAMKESFRNVSASLELISKNFATEQIRQLQQIDFSAMFADVLPKASSLSEALQAAYSIVEDELDEKSDVEDTFIEEEIQEVFQEQIENPEKFQERVGKWTQKKIMQYYIVFQIISFIWGNFLQPYFQDNIGKPVVAYIVSNVKELPQKGAKEISTFC